MTAPLELHDIAIRLGTRTLVEGLSLTVPPGGAATIMGPSGAGKSSVLAYVAGFLDRAFAASGSVRVGGREVTGLPAEKRGVALLFQDDLLFPHLSVAGNLLFGVPRAAPDREKRVTAALTEAGLEGFGPRDPATLSGGQRARVSLLRALLSEPRALLLDEPFGKLDAELRQAFRAQVFEAARARGLPVLMVTHDPADAAAAGGEVVRMG